MRLISHVLLNRYKESVGKWHGENIQQLYCLHYFTLVMNIQAYMAKKKKKKKKRKK